MKKQNLLFPVILVLLTLLTSLTCSKSSYNNDDDGNGGNNNPPTVYMKNATFTSASLTITVGGTVVWVNDDTMVHTVTAKDGSFNSGDIQVNGSYSKTFSATGTYPYQCLYHTTMVGTIVVVTK